MKIVGKTNTISVVSAQGRGKEIGIGVACGAVLLIVVVIAGIGVVINVKKSKNGKFYEKICNLQENFTLF